MNWPSEVKQQLGGRDPQIGDWYAFCCNNDAFKIETQAELESLYEQVGDLLDDGCDPGYFFKTEEAVSEYFGGMG